MPFRYRCNDCEFDHFSPGIAEVHENRMKHTVETYEVDDEEYYTYP